MDEKEKKAILDSCKCHCGDCNANCLSLAEYIKKLEDDKQYALDQLHNAARVINNLGYEIAKWKNL